MPTINEKREILSVIEANIQQAQDTQTLASLIYNGCRGYKALTDKEVIDEWHDLITSIAKEYRQDWWQQVKNYRID